MVDRDKYGVQRRVAGVHDFRLDGVSDVLSRCRGASVLDLGCNRGMVSLEMARNGAEIVHGLDYDPGSIDVARSVFADCRYVDYKFEVADLSKGVHAVKEHFPTGRYTFLLLLATLHKLHKQMPLADELNLCRYLGTRTDKWFVWRGTEGQRDVNLNELTMLDELLDEVGLERVHTSELSDLGIAAIWERRQ